MQQSRALRKGPRNPGCKIFRAQWAAARLDATSILSQFTLSHSISWSNQWMQVYEAQAWAWECFRLLLHQLNTSPLPSSQRTVLLPQPSFLDCCSCWCGHGSRRNGDPHGPCPAYVPPRGTIVQCPETPYCSPVVQKTPLIFLPPSPLSPAGAQEALQICPSEG